MSAVLETADEKRVALLALLAERERRTLRRKLWTDFPDDSCCYAPQRSDAVH